MRPHEQRVVEEKQELEEKISKLDKFRMGYSFPQLSTEEQVRLNRQLTVMIEYAKILSERIAAFPPC